MLNYQRVRVPYQRTLELLPEHTELIFLGSIKAPFNQVMLKTTLNINIWVVFPGVQWRIKSPFSLDPLFDLQFEFRVLIGFWRRFLNILALNLCEVPPLFDGTKSQGFVIRSLFLGCLSSIEKCEIFCWSNTQLIPVASTVVWLRSFLWLCLQNDQILGDSLLFHVPIYIGNSPNVCW